MDFVSICNTDYLQNPFLFYFPKLAKIWSAIKQGKESEFAIALEQLDFGMCVEKIIRQLKGLKEDDEKYPPGYFKKMADLMDEYIRNEKE